MKLQHVAFSGLAGTSAMTLFSYIAAVKTEESNQKIPLLLGELLKEILPESCRHQAPLAGWLSHFSIGVSWAWVYDYLYQNTEVRPSLKNGLILGSCSGLLGVAIWKIIFKMHPHPPRTNLKKFFIQLYLAHLVYSVAITALNKQPRHRLSS